MDLLFFILNIFAERIKLSYLISFASTFTGRVSVNVKELNFDTGGVAMNPFSCQQGVLQHP